MEIILVLLISAILSGCLVFVNSILAELVPIALHADNYMTTMMGTNGITVLFDIFFGFGVSLIVLKFLKNGFETYVLWTDGEADADPMLLLTNFLKALAIAICFPTLYGWMTTIIEELTNQFITSLSDSMATDFTTIINGIASAGLFTAIVSLIFFIVFIFLYLQFLMRGLEILILRIGIPIACVGFMDKNNGIFSSYIKKFFEAVAAVVVQIGLAKLGVALMLNGHVFWGLASVIMAVKTPKFLQGLMAAPSGATGVSGTTGAVYQTTRLVGMAKSAFVK